MRDDCILSLHNRFAYQDEMIQVQTDLDNIEKPEQCPDWASRLKIVTEIDDITVPFNKITIFDPKEGFGFIHFYVLLSSLWHPNVFQHLVRRSVQQTVSDPLTVDSLELSYGVCPTSIEALYAIPVSDIEVIPVKIITFTSLVLLCQSFTPVRNYSDNPFRGTIACAFQVPKDDITVAECDA